MRGVVGVVASLVAAGSMVAASTAAYACWDGSLAQVGDVTLQDGDDVWDAQSAIERAQWLSRIDLILPEGARLEVWGEPVLELEGESIDLVWKRGGLPGLFDVVAKKLKVSPLRAAMVRNLTVPVFTIQAGSFATEAQAARRAELIGAQCPHGFYEAGGFPAENSAAHVERTEAGHFRVVVGTFLSRAEAAEAQKCLSEIQDYSGDSESFFSFPSFVRRFDKAVLATAR